MGCRIFRDRRNLWDMGRDVRQNGISSGEITKIFQPELLDTGQLRRRADTQTLTPPRNGASILEVSPPYQLFFLFLLYL